MLRFAKFSTHICCICVLRHTYEYRCWQTLNLTRHEIV